MRVRLADLRGEEDGDPVEAGGRSRGRHALCVPAVPSAMKRGQCGAPSATRPPKSDVRVAMHIH